MKVIILIILACCLMASDCNTKWLNDLQYVYVDENYFYADFQEPRSSHHHHDNDDDWWDYVGIGGSVLSLFTLF